MNYSNINCGCYSLIYMSICAQLISSRCLTNVTSTIRKIRGNTYTPKDRLYIWGGPETRQTSISASIVSNDTHMVNRILHSIKYVCLLIFTIQCHFYDLKWTTCGLGLTKLLPMSMLWEFNTNRPFPPFPARVVIHSLTFKVQLTFPISVWDLFK